MTLHDVKINHGSLQSDLDEGEVMTSIPGIQLLAEKLSVNIYCFNFAIIGDSSRFRFKRMSV